MGGYLASMSEHRKYVCIHGHFYQPPRENAWLETIEVQDSAAPFHDWNERINEECYAPNATARVLNDQRRITDISNNYARISWNMGPTLLAWLEEHDPTTYARILRADRLSQARFSGHGSALAQSYNHIIMPLANARDRATQVRWGVADFEHRFGRRPEGMWLAETAADTATLEALVDEGIAFTVLAPRQCHSVRHGEAGEWHEVHGGVDPRRAYRCPLPSGRSIDLFFYDGQVAKGVAFEGLLNDGRSLADRLTGTLDDDDAAQLAHIATDGESYGHHHRHGEMALTAALDHLDASAGYQLTNYGEFLERHPPEWEARIHDNSSWSCAHGVERWRSDCGCETGGQPGWHQRWRQPLREALDSVRDRLVHVFDQRGGQLFGDPWAARDAYIRLVLDRDPGRAEAFLSEHGRSDTIQPAQKVEMLRLLEMQRHAMLMYTSCAWFFNEVSGIETLQVLQYANRALHLCAVITGQDYHPDFLGRLRLIESNVEHNAAVAYERSVIPARVGLLRVGMHFAAASLFEEDVRHLELFNYRSRTHDLRRLRAGGYLLSLGRTTILSKLTHSQATFAYAVLYLGQQTMIGEITTELSAEQFAPRVAALEQDFRNGNLNDVINQMKDHFGGANFSMWNLFRDEKQKILLEMIERSTELAAANFSSVYYDNFQLMSTMRANGLPLPDSYRASIQFTLRRRLLEALRAPGDLDAERLTRIVDDHLHWQHDWTDAAELNRAAEARLLTKVRAAFSDPSRWATALLLIRAVHQLGLNPDYHRAQTEFLERWTVGYVFGLDERIRQQAETVGAELNLDAGALRQRTRELIGN